MPRPSETKLGSFKAITALWSVFSQLRAIGEVGTSDLTVAGLRARVAPFLEIGDMIADMTQTDVDDQLVDLGRQMLANDTVMELAVTVLKRLLDKKSESPDTDFDFVSEIKLALEN